MSIISPVRIKCNYNAEHFSFSSVNTGAKCLKELCVSVVTSAILLNGSVGDPEQLNDRLPAYTPADVKASIVHQVKAGMLNLVEFHYYSR